MRMFTFLKKSLFQNKTELKIEKKQQLVRKEGKQCRNMILWKITQMGTFIEVMCLGPIYSPISYNDWTQFLFFKIEFSYYYI